MKHLISGELVNAVPDHPESYPDHTLLLKGLEAPFDQEALIEAADLFSAFLSEEKIPSEPEG